MTKEDKMNSGFHSCGRYYSMGKSTMPELKLVKYLLNEIRANALNSHYTKPLKTTK